MNVFYYALFSVTGIITSSGGCMVGERLSISGTHLNLTSQIQCTPPKSAPQKTTSTESVNKVLKSVSKQNLLGKCKSIFRKVIISAWM